MRWRNLFCRSRNNSLDVLLRRAPEMRYLRGYQSKADEDWQTAYSPTIEVFAIPHKPKPFAKIVEQTLGQYRLEIWEPVRLSAHAVAKAWRICVRNVQDETCHFFGIIALYCGLAQRAKDSVAHSIVIRDARLLISAPSRTFVRNAPGSTSDTCIPGPILHSAGPRYNQLRRALTRNRMPPRFLRPRPPASPR